MCFIGNLINPCMEHLVKCRLTSIINKKCYCECPECKYNIEHKISRNQERPFFDISRRNSQVSNSTMCDIDPWMYSYEIPQTSFQQFSIKTQ